MGLDLWNWDWGGMIDRGNQQGLNQPGVGRPGGAPLPGSLPQTGNGVAFTAPAPVWQAQPEPPKPEPPKPEPSYQKAANPFTDAGGNLTGQAADALKKAMAARTTQANTQFAGLSNAANVGLAGRGMLGGGQQKAVQGGLDAQKAITLGSTEAGLIDRYKQLGASFEQNEQARVDGGGQADLLYALRKAEFDNALSNQSLNQTQQAASLIPQLIMAMFPTNGTKPPALFKGNVTGGSNNA